MYKLTYVYELPHGVAVRQSGLLVDPGTLHVLINRAFERLSLPREALIDIETPKDHGGRGLGLRSYIRTGQANLQIYGDFSTILCLNVSFPHVQNSRTDISDSQLIQHAAQM